MAVGGVLFHPFLSTLSTSFRHFFLVSGLNFLPWGFDECDLWGGIGHVGKFLPKAAKICRKNVKGGGICKIEDQCVVPREALHDWDLFLTVLS